MGLPRELFFCARSLVVPTGKVTVETGPREGGGTKERIFFLLKMPRLHHAAPPTFSEKGVNTHKVATYEPTK